MNDQQLAPRIAYASRHRSTIVLLAHIMLWLQGGLLVLAWVFPIGLFVVAMALGGADSESGYILWLLVIFAVVPFLLSLLAIAVAAMFSWRRNGVRWGAIGYESFSVMSAILIAKLLDNAFSMLFIASMLMGLVIIVALLHPSARAHFDR